MRTRAAVLYESGKPAPYSQSRPLVIEELELSGPGPGEVLVQVSAAGLCHSDLSVIDGSRPWPLPMVLGHEASGVVREVGKEVRGFSSGDHVVFSFIPVCGRCEPCAVGRPALCMPGIRANVGGMLLTGNKPFASLKGQSIHHFLGVAGFSEFTVVAAESLVKIDPSFPLDKAALFGCAVITGVGAVANAAKVEPGASVAVFGMGGVGLSAVMGARAMGAHPTVAVDVLKDKLEGAKAAGASHVIDASAGDPAKAIRELTRGGAEYAIECAGRADVLMQAYAATRRGGTTVTIGLPNPNQEFKVSAFSLTADERTVKGSFMGSAVPARDIPRYMSMYGADLLPVDSLVTRSISLDQINEGFDALATGQAVRQLIRYD
ncbi:MAG: zinc-dependent alcohol dehydrogenase family protein [Planctomycetota bacterium]